MTDCIRKGDFVWTMAASRAFHKLKEKMIEAPILRLPDFSKPFEVTCDAFGVGIGGVLSQEGHPIAFFSEKLNDAKLKYSTYDKEFYVVVQALRYWRHYLLPQEFVLYSDHEALRFLNSQKKLNSRHGSWVEFLQPYPYVIKHKEGVENKVADALSHQASILTATSSEVTGFDRIKNDYDSCPNFGEVYKILVDGLVREHDDYFLLEGTSSKPTSYVSPELPSETSSFGKYMMVECQAISGETRLSQLSKILSFDQLSIETLLN